jgi:uncharacterized delta-60 repeat protein
VGDEPGASSGGSDGGTADGTGDVTLNGDSGADVASTDDTGADANAGTATLALAKASRWLNKGSSVSVDFTVTRGTATVPLTVHVNGLPTGVTAADVVVSGTATTGTITFNGGSTAVPGATATLTVQLQGIGQVLDSKPFLLRVAGTSGSVDPTFGTSSVATVTVHAPGAPTTPGNTSVDAMAIYPPSAGANAGKIVVAGLDTMTVSDGGTTRNFFIARFNADGTPDTTFGEIAGAAHAGYVLIDRGTVNPPAAGMLGVAIDSQGRIFGQGFQELGACNTETMRVDANGVADSQFIYDGNLRGGYCGGVPGGAVMLPGDKPAIVALWNISDGTQEPVLVEYNSDGTTALGPTTLSNPEATRATLYTQNMLADATGRFLLFGTKCDGGWNGLSNCVATVARLTSTFAFDTTFGVMGSTARLGVQYADFGSTGAGYDRFMNGAIDAKGNIVAAGWDGSELNGTLVRILATDGTLDSTFGTGGKVVVNAVPSSTYQVFYSDFIDEDGRIAAVGRNTFGGTSYALSVRLQPNGQIDTTYGTNGVATNPLNNGYAAAMTADGRLLVAGNVPRTGGGNDLAVWRLWP